MGRFYSIPMDAKTIGTAVQDIFTVKCGSGGLVLHAIHLDSANTAPAPCRMRLRRATATITVGSGGTGPTPVVHKGKVSSLAADATARINDTTQATTSGAFTDILFFNWDTVLPFDYLPTPEMRFDCILNQGFVLDLPATLAVAVVASGYLTIEELP